MGRKVCKARHCYNSVSGLIAGNRCALHSKGCNNSRGPISSLRAEAAELPEAQAVIFDQMRAEGFTLKDSLRIAKRDSV